MLGTGGARARTNSSKNRAALALAIGLSGLFLIQGYFGSLDKSLTFDEPLWISSGYASLTRNDFRIGKDAPPLMKQLAALPLLGMEVELPPKDGPAWRDADDTQFVFEFSDLNEERLAQIGRRARMPVLLLGAGLVLSIFLWGRRLYGPVPALAATAAATISPNLLAHSKVATTDLGCAAFMFLAVWAFWRAVRSDKPLDWALCGAATGLALLAKYTALLLGPIFLALAALVFIQRRGVSLAFLRGSVVAAAVMTFVVGAGFNFSFDYSFYLEGYRYLREIYLFERSGQLNYLFGALSAGPFPHYHLAVLAVKTPLPSIGLLGLAAFELVRDAEHREAALFLLLPAAVVLGASVFDPVNIGLRRVLPALPFLLLFTAQALAGEPSRVRQGAVALLLTWGAVEAARIYPHHLAYFNLAAGGPERGPYLLDDSNIDWGQDLPALATWQREHADGEPLHLSYFGRVPPSAYGVESVPLQAEDFFIQGPGYYAVSAHTLVWFRKIKAQTGLAIDWLTRYEPVGRAGYSIYIYRFDGAGQPVRVP
ncbi:MAG: glycosyltransferase family 39 protein [Gemmatimonadales bacterium]